MKKPIAAILTDTHLKEENIEVNISIYRQAIQIAKSLGLSQIDHAGDVFNSRKAQSQLVLTTFCSILDEIDKADLRLCACVGNHDKTSYGAVESFLDPFAEHPALNLYRTSGRRGTFSENIDLAFLSYFDEEIYLKELESFRFVKEHTVLITHIGCAGAVMNSGTVVESKVTTNSFSKYSRVLIGHYHDAQSLNEKVHYIGSSLQHSYGEKTGKGLTVLYNDLSTEIIPLKYPQYIKYEVKPSEITKDDIVALQQEKTDSGDNIRVVLVGNDKELKSFNKQHLENAGISVQHKADLVDRVELEQRIEPFDTKSLLKEFENFCSKNNLDKEQGYKYFKAIIE
jgi:exonuclease SbcD